MTRHYWNLLHRWAGLVTAGLLIIVAITGSLLAFYPELERLINPQLYPRKVFKDELDPATIAELAEQRVPNVRVNAVLMEANQEATLVMIDPILDKNGQTGELDFNQMILDPYTGEELARRYFGAISQGMINFMPFIYKLHYTLALGSLGMWILGICALIWTVDCFVGFYLTLPLRRRKLPTSTSSTLDIKNWCQRWLPAWKFRWRSSTYKLNFDLHRASGLWSWLILFIFAWSSVYMNLWDTAYTWATRTVFDYKTSWTELPKLDEPLHDPKIDWRQAQVIGERFMDEQAKIHDFKILQVVALRLDRERGVYNYVVRSSRDIQDKRGATHVFFDANTGEFKLVLLPSGQYSGNTVTSWLYALHMANIFGLPYRIFVFMLGFIIAMLSVTGIVIWLKKRRARMGIFSS